MSVGGLVVVDAEGVDMALGVEGEELRGEFIRGKPERGEAGRRRFTRLDGRG